MELEKKKKGKKMAVQKKKKFNSGHITRKLTAGFVNV